MSDEELRAPSDGSTTSCASCVSAETPASHVSAETPPAHLHEHAAATAKGEHVSAGTPDGFQPAHGRSSPRGAWLGDSHVPVSAETARRIAPDAAGTPADPVSAVQAPCSSAERERGPRSAAAHTLHGVILPERRIDPAPTSRLSPRRPVGPYPPHAVLERNDTMSITAAETETIAATLRSALETEADVVAAYFYGSVARGVHRSKSDVDVALLLDSDPPKTLDGLRLDLASRLGDELGKPVDIVILNRAPCDLAHRVRRDGVVLIDRDRRRRIAWEVKSRNEYFDMEPIRRLYRHGRSRS